MFATHAIEIPVHSIVTIPTRRNSKCTSSTPCVYELQVNEMFITQDPEVFMLPAIYLKNETEPDHVPITCQPFE